MPAVETGLTEEDTMHQTKRWAARLGLGVAALLMATPAPAIADLYGSPWSSTPVAAGSTATFTATGVDFHDRWTYSPFVSCASSSMDVIVIDAAGTEELAITDASFSGCAMGGTPVAVTAHTSPPWELVVDPAGTSNPFASDIDAVHITIAGMMASGSLALGVTWDNVGAAADELQLVTADYLSAFVDQVVTGTWTLSAPWDLR